MRPALTLAALCVEGKYPAVNVAAIYTPRKSPGSSVPLAGASVHAGFPSPADDYAEQPLDLHGYLVKNPAATFIVKACGDSMIGAGIHDGDLLVVDRSRNAIDGSVVVAHVDGQFTVKRLRKTNGRVWLAAANSKYTDIPVSNDDMVWGVVVHSIHTLGR